MAVRAMSIWLAFALLLFSGCGGVEESQFVATSETPLTGRSFESLEVSQEGDGSAALAEKNSRQSGATRDGQVDTTLGVDDEPSVTESDSSGQESKPQPGLAQEGLKESDCLYGSGPKVTIEGSQAEKYRNSEFAAGTVFDATSATWSGRDSAGSLIDWAVTIRGEAEGACWVGGRIVGAWDENSPSVTWEDPYHHSGAFTIETANFVIDGVRIENNGDGIRPYAPNVTIRNSYLTDIHDDCVENDDGHEVMLDNSFLDGCYVGLSSRPHATSEQKRGNIWTVRDSLIRLEIQPTVYKGSAPGHGGFFKWDSAGNGPKLAIHDTILRADQAPNHGTLGLPEGLELESCSNNTVVWLGSGPFPASLPDCFVVTTDKSVWDSAADDWLADHLVAP